MNIGGLHLMYNSFNTYQNFTISNNSAEQNIGGIQIDTSIEQQLEDFQINNNFANGHSGGLFIFQGTNITLNNLDFQSNISKYKAGAYKLDNSKNIFFNNTQLFNNTSNICACSYIEICQNITLQNSNIYYNTANQATAFYVIKSENIYSINNKIMNNNSFKKGAVFQISQDSDKIFIFQNQILNNFSKEGATSLCINDIGNIEIQNTIFKNNTSITNSAGIQGQKVKNVKLLNVTIENHLSEYGSCIHMIDMDSITITNSQFNNNLSLLQGGCLNTEKVAQIYIKNSKFQNNSLNIFKDEDDQNKNGGALNIQQTFILDIQDSLFQNNTAFLQGGALYLYNIQQTNILNTIISVNTVNFDQSIGISQKTEQYILSQGGGIYYEYYLQDTEQEQEEIQIQFNKNLIQNCQASSGAGIFLNINIPQNIIINTNFEDNTFQQNIADIGPSIRYIGSLQQQSIDIIKNQISQQVKLENKGLVSEDKYFFGYYKNEKKINKKYTKFKLCTKGSFLLEGGNIECDKCIQNGECLGGYIQISPQEEYWRSDKQSMQFYYCSKYPELCLGDDQCLEGHKGLLCEDCKLMEGYAKGLNGECNKCQEGAPIVLIIFGLLSISFILVTQQIYGINSKVKTHLKQQIMKRIWNVYTNKISKLSAISKILLMHIQIIYLTESISFQWSLGISSLFSIVGNPSQSLSFNSQCIFEVNNEEDEINVVYFSALVGLGFITSLAIILFLIVIIFYLFKKIEKNQIIQYISCTLICFFLTVQPGYIQHTFSFLTCRTFSNISYTKSDNLILCDSDNYKNNILPTMLTLFCLVFFIIPLFFIFKLYQNNKKNSLSRVKSLRSFGILYIDAKPQFYLWEVLTLIFALLQQNPSNNKFESISFIRKNENMFQNQKRKSKTMVYNNEDNNNNNKLQQQPLSLQNIEMIDKQSARSSHNTTISNFDENNNTQIDQKNSNLHFSRHQIVRDTIIMQKPHSVFSVNQSFNLTQRQLISNFNHQQQHQDDTSICLNKD